MKYCRNCGKAIEKDEKTYNELCVECFKEYLYRKIDNYALIKGKEMIEPHQKRKKFINFIKRIFKKK